MLNQHQVQAASGLVISLFAVTHLVNHSLMHFGAEAHQAMFRRVRAVLRTVPGLELALFVGLGVHAAIAVKNFSGFRDNIGQDYFWHQASGWAMMFTLPPHIMFNRFRGPKLYPPGDEYDVSHNTMAFRVAPFFFFPIYLCMTVGAAVHTYTGIARAARILDIRALLKMERLLPMSGQAYYNVILPLSALAVSTVFAVAGVYFRYKVKHQEAHAKCIKDDIPKFYADRVDMSNDVWFSRFRLWGVVPKKI